MRAATYTRLSDDGQSIPDQQQGCRNYASDRSWEIVGEFKDEGRSAFRNVERRGFDALLAKIDSGAVDVVIARHHDRLTRNPASYSRLLEACVRHGVEVHTYAGGGVLNFSQSQSGFMGMISTATAWLESAVKRERIAEAVARNVAAGKRTGGGPRPFGYDLEYVDVGPAPSDGGVKRQRRRIVSEQLNDQEANLVRVAAARVLAGESLRGIARDWNQLGHTTTQGNAWYPKALQTLLRSARIAGWREHKGKLVVEAEWPAIVDLDTHKQLRAVLDDPLRRTQRGTARKHLLPGYLYCGKPECGSRMVSGARSFKGGKTRVYVCPACQGIRIQADTVEAIITEAVLERLSSPRVEEALAADSDSEDEIKQLIKERTAAGRRLAQSRDDYADGLITRSDLHAIKKRIDGITESAQRKIDSMQSGAGLKHVIGDPGSVRVAWASWGLDQRRALLNALIGKIVVGPHPKGVATQPVDPRVIGQRLNVEWLV